MTRLRVRLSTVVVFGLVGAAIAVGSVSASAAGVATPVITGLNSPRGLTFDSAGSLYVSESGVAGSGEAGIATLGRVRKYAWRIDDPSVVHGLRVAVRHRGSVAAS